MDLEGTQMRDALEQGAEILASIVKLEDKMCRPEWDLSYKNAYAFYSSQL